MFPIFHQSTIRGRSINNVFHTVLSFQRFLATSALKRLFPFNTQSFKPLLSIEDPYISRNPPWTYHRRLMEREIPLPRASFLDLNIVYYVICWKRMAMEKDGGGLCLE